jgi:hypothetical protein
VVEQAVDTTTLLIILVTLAVQAAVVAVLVRLLTELVQPIKVLTAA